jgi:hypothetical protein
MRAPPSSAVANAQRESGYDAKTWNLLDQVQRDGFIRAELERLGVTFEARAADAADATAPEGSPAAAADATKEDAAANPSGATTPAAEPTVDDRIAYLIQNNTEDQLRNKIAAFNEGRAEGDQLVAKSDYNKPDLARLLVDADADVEADTGGVA